MKTGKKYRFFTLILPLVLLLFFVGLFVGSSIVRRQLRKELTELQNNTDRPSDPSRLTEIEERNQTISYIIGRDEEMERGIEEMRVKSEK